MKKTLEEIRTLGLAVLKKELGTAGMIRFLQQFDRGTGDWASERQRWTRRITMDDIRKAAPSPQSRNRGRKSTSRRRSVPRT